MLTWRGQKQDRQIAQNTATRAEAAARLTEGYTSRVVVALEAMAQREASSTGQATPAVVRWSLRRQAGDTYILENVGTASAERIQVTADDSLPLLSMSVLPERLGPDEALSFMAAPSLGTSDFTITVEWVTAGDDVPRQWRYPLPYRS